MASTFTSGIIPARAGFTSRPRSCSRRSPDHPRSRGVYGMSDTAYHADTGSSPLARGLPGRGGGAAPGDRIIPARAGFTLGRMGPDHGDRDHPRSRGVYSRRAARVVPEVGSSPLARGLRGPGGARRRGCRDHPRSRGVYNSTSKSFLASTGSSPLARGLHKQWRDKAIAWRIIPARAGFTTRGGSSRGTGSDHPRSRGVYA